MRYLEIDISYNNLGRNNENCRYLGQCLKCMLGLKYLNLDFNSNVLGDYK